MIFCLENFRQFKTNCRMVFMWLAGCAADLLFRAIPLLAAITAIYICGCVVYLSHSHIERNAAQFWRTLLVSEPWQPLHQWLPSAGPQ
jgi:hypothetical protein